MKKILLVVVILLLVAGGGWYFIRHRAAPAEPETAKVTATVQVAPVIDGPIAQTIEVFGVVAAAPSGDRVLSVPYDVMVRKVLVGVGITVQPGDVLLEVDLTPDAKLAADSARSVRALAEKTLTATQERYDLRLANRQELQSAQQAAEDAKLKSDRLASNVLDQEGHITAVTAGVVSKLDLLAGATATAGSPLVTVSTGGQLEVRLGVEAGELADVAKGQPVTVESSNRSVGEKISTTVRTVGGSLDPVAGSAEVRAALPAGSPLFLGEHVRALIETVRKEHALVVPRTALLPDDDKQVLFVVKDGKAVRQEVKLGLVTDELVEVTGEGLKAGDAVVILGNYELEDGMAVQTAQKEKGGPTKAAAKPDAEAKP